MRLFTGISLSAEVLHRLGGVIAELERSARANWAPVENLHLTLKFIGSWPDERLAELEGALQSVRPGPAFPVRVAQLGYFPNPHRPHSLFAGVQAGPELAELAGGVDRAAAAIGIKAEEREFR
ncbi:MAG TPA: RNA 2',3'-cyclic phosphodiesterase, partial [Bryobacteraceae bacterium]|nr:RNA 2',3'-cyclic phosphodiesterase [Bryobacteraceae bacterium]